MRKETLLVVGFLAIVIGTSALIWSYALPDLKPVRFPEVASATITLGPTRDTRPLTPEETTSLDQWLHGHERGWGPMTTKAPSSGDAAIHVVPKSGEAFTLTLWNGLSGADWDKTVVVQFSPTKPFRIHTFDKGDWLPLQRLMEQQPYERTDVP